MVYSGGEGRGGGGGGLCMKHVVWHWGGRFDFLTSFDFFRCVLQDALNSDTKTNSGQIVE